MYAVVLLVGFHEVMLVEQFGDVVEIPLTLNRKGVQYVSKFVRNDCSWRVAFN
jgi:hypothetical protein